MASMKEIKNRIKSVRDTQKITNAMYLISSAKMRKAKSELDKTRPYFNAVQAEIKRIFRTVPDVDSRYFYPPEGSEKLNGTFGCLVITADRGLAGAYNHNVLKAAMALREKHEDMKFFVVGEYGRQFFYHKRIPIEESFLYPAQNPTMQRAREISARLLEDYDQGKLDKIFIIYTDLKNGLNAEPVETRILPFHRGEFTDTSVQTAEFEFLPSVQAVLDSMMPSYVSGYVYSALVDSFCSEQNARMAAMNSAGQNADKILEGLTVQYNRVRQAGITREITEISAGFKAQKKKRKKVEQK